MDTYPKFNAEHLVPWNYDAADPLTYMIVYYVEAANRKLSGVYMADETTIKTFANYQSAAEESNRLDRFMEGCGFKSYTRVVKVVDNG